MRYKKRHECKKIRGVFFYSLLQFVLRKAIILLDILLRGEILLEKIKTISFLNKLFCFNFAKPFL